jgi:hypothetical protein
MRLASRVAINRTVAGVHFPVDSAAGAVLGLTLGHYFLSRCATGFVSYDWTFDGDNYSFGAAPPGDGDFYWEEHYDERNSARDQTATTYSTKGSSVAPDQADVLAWLWSEACGEWKR